MKLGLHYQGQYPEPVRSELAQMVAAITTADTVEHDAEGRQRRTQGRFVLGVAQSIPNGGLTTAVGPYRPSVENEGDLVLDNATRSVRVSTSGIYAVTGYVRFAANAAGIRTAVLVRNGTRMAHAQVGPVVPDTHVQVSDPGLPCSAGTVIRLEVFQNSGGALALVPTADACDQTWLRIVKVA